MSKRLVYLVFFLVILVFIGLYGKSQLHQYFTKGNFRNLVSYSDVNDTTRRLIQTVVYNYDSTRKRLGLPVFSDHAELNINNRGVVLEEELKDQMIFESSYFIWEMDARVFYEIGSIRNDSVELRYVLGSPSAVDSLVLFGKRDPVLYKFYNYFSSSLIYLNWPDSSVDLSKPQFDSLAHRLLSE